MINGERDYDARSSPPTSRPSARPANARACRRFKSAVLKLPRLNQVLHHHTHNHNSKVDQEDKDEDEEDQVQLLARRLKETGLAFHQQVGGEKHSHHRHQNEEKKKDGKKEEYQYGYQYDRYGQQTQQRVPQQQYASKRNSTNLVRGYDLTTACDTNDFTAALPASPQHGKHKKDYKRVGSPPILPGVELIVCSLAR